MMTRRSFLTTAAASSASLVGSQAVMAKGRNGAGVSAGPCAERMADPPWVHLSSAAGDLPTPALSDNQTSCVAGDIDGDGRADFVITGRNERNSAIWMQNTGRIHEPQRGWRQYVIDPGPRNLEAGGALFDVDGDGHLDLVVGGDNTTNEVWWWENPYPNYAQAQWKRHLIKDSGKNQHHDLMFGDVLGEGKPQLVFWNQGATALFLARIPEDARNRTSPWDLHIIYQAEDPMEGLAMADIDGDGVVEVVGGGRGSNMKAASLFLQTSSMTGRSSPAPPPANSSRMLPERRWCFAAATGAEN